MPNRSAKVIQCDLEGNDIRSFESPLEAALSFDSNYPDVIRKAIRHGLVAFGYRWKYKGTELIYGRRSTPGVRNSIVALSLATNEEQTYPSLSSASRALSIGVSAIEHSLQTGGTVKGYRFRYDGEGLQTSPRKVPYRRKVVAIDDSDNVVAEYADAYECARARGVINSAVYWCLNPKHPNSKCKGHRLRYKD